MYTENELKVQRLETKKQELNGLTGDERAAKEAELKSDLEDITAPF